MANDENLIPPKKGEVRNPNGRPKGSRNRATIYRELLEQAALSKYKKAQAKALLGEDAKEDDLKQKSIADQVVASLLVSALRGDVSAAKELMDSGFGKLTDKLENMHSFNKMGEVEAKISDGESKQSVKLSFEVGSEPKHNKED